MKGIGPYIKFARPLYEGKDPGHDFRHIERIISRLDELSEGLNPVPVPHRLFFLACFHGLGPRIRRESELRESTVAFLEGLGWEKSEIEVILSSLETHLGNPKTAEEMIVHDANYYEIAGAFGIVKAFTVGGSHGQSYETTIERYERFLRRTRFRTPFGKRNYEPRKSYAWEFLWKLIDELELD